MRADKLTTVRDFMREARRLTRTLGEYVYVTQHRVTGELTLTRHAFLHPWPELKVVARKGAA